MTKVTLENYTQAVRFDRLDEGTLFLDIQRGNRPCVKIESSEIKTPYLHNYVTVNAASLDGTLIGFDDDCTVIPINEVILKVI